MVFKVGEEVGKEVNEWVHYGIYMNNGRAQQHLRKTIIHSDMISNL
jgi:hypothetical protein